MKKTTAGRKVNNVKRRLVSALLLAAVTLTATGSVWESPCGDGAGGTFYERTAEPHQQSSEPAE